jgi:hypothetical protein
MMSEDEDEQTRRMAIKQSMSGEGEEVNEWRHDDPDINVDK